MTARLLAVLLVPFLTVPAWADSAMRVAAQLRVSPAYQAPGLALVDVQALAEELTGTDPQVFVAVLPAGAPSAADILRALGDPEAVILVVTDDQHLGVAAGAGAVSRGVDAADGLAQELAAAPAGPYDQVQLTALVVAFAERMAGQVSGDGPDLTRTVPPARTSPTPVPAAVPQSTSRSPWLWVLGGVAVVLGVGALVLRHCAQPPWRRRGQQAG